MRRLLLILLVATAATAAPKRRSVAVPGADSFLAHPLRSTELVADSSDLEPLRGIVGNAAVVGLGDDTHGTHEFFTLKLRLADFLVREMGFDVFSIEGPFPIFERINVYAQGGPGDPRALLREVNSRLLYLFWDVEEMLAVIEWVRDYNLHRGDRRPIEIVGSDIYDEQGGVEGVLAYLRGVDPAAAAEAEREYACVLARDRSSACGAGAQRVREALLARQDGDGRTYQDALHYAETVTNSFTSSTFSGRERAQAANVLWAREHRGSARKVMHWGHQEHVSKLQSPYTHGLTMGTLLAGQLGAEYVAIGTLTGSGSFLQWERVTPGADVFRISLQTYPDPIEGTYELAFRRRGIPAMLVPLRGRIVPGTKFRTGGTTSGWTYVEQRLWEKLDAVIYVDRTTPTRPL
ncbi:MAG: erythromycin esterase family protein [Acidobacteriota bacterium]|nr:erythromycin esterase family protein [Acidobacteriota bacterium]